MALTRNLVVAKNDISSRETLESFSGRGFSAQPFLDVQGMQEGRAGDWDVSFRRELAELRSILTIYARGMQRVMPGEDLSARYASDTSSARLKTDFFLHKVNNPAANLLRTAFPQLKFRAATRGPISDGTLEGYLDVVVEAKTAADAAIVNPGDYADHVVVVIRKLRTAIDGLAASENPLLRDGMKAQTILDVLKLPGLTDAAGVPLVLERRRDKLNTVEPGAGDLIIRPLMPLVQEELDSGLGKPLIESVSRSELLSAKPYFDGGAKDYLDTLQSVLDAAVGILRIDQQLRDALQHIEKRE